MSFVWRGRSIAAMPESCSTTELVKLNWVPNLIQIKTPCFCRALRTAWQKHDVWTGPKYFSNIRKIQRFGVFFFLGVAGVSGKVRIPVKPRAVHIRPFSFENAIFLVRFNWPASTSKWRKWHRQHSNSKTLSEFFENPCNFTTFWRCNPSFTVWQSVISENGTFENAVTSRRPKAWLGQAICACFVDSVFCFPQVNNDNYAKTFLNEEKKLHSDVGHVWTAP